MPDPKKRILVVEDNILNRGILVSILSGEYEVLEAGNGQEALDVLESCADSLSLIFLDLVMPVMDGYTFLDRLKDNLGFSSIPVIVAANSDDVGDEIAALEKGATDYVTKPYQAQVILRRAAGIIKLRETAAMVNLMKNDVLTGLYRKEYFYQMARELLNKGDGTVYDLICFDFENFKLVNDVFGVATGDKVLRHAAGVFKELSSGRGLCGRLDSDHFAFLIEHRSDYCDEMFMAAMDRINSFPGINKMSAKWGIYTIESPELSMEQICDRALLAAHSIKGQYGKRFAFYDEALRHVLLYQQEIENTMEQALEQEQFLVYLQPKFNIYNEKIIGAEALVRWNHPEKGFLSPGSFIPLFESNGFITRLDMYVWDKTCALLRRWINNGLSPVPVSVNVSRADIYNADLPQILRRLMEKHGISPELLHLEITESAYTENPKQIVETVEELRDIGFLIEMDDFGSGYSSLNMLNELPIDVLKLDMGFIQNETTRLEPHGILELIVSLARWLNLSVVAEGVETKSQVDKLRELGCLYVQGYYFSVPLSPEDFEPLLLNQEASRDTEDENIWYFNQDSSSYVESEPVILVASADQEELRVFQDLFRQEYRVATSSDGAEALSFIRKYKSDVAISVINMNLPGKDRASLLETMKKDQSLWNIPVLAMGRGGDQEEARAFELGADDYMASTRSELIIRSRVSKTIKAFVQRRKAQLLREDAYRDYLTGLLNRRGLQASLEGLAEDCGSNAVFMFDVDNLKLCNDAFGHSEGDGLLLRMGDVLRTHTRTGDILARVGGDEFVAVIRNIPDAGTALKKGHQICASMQDSNPKSSKFMPSCSAGVAIMNPGDDFVNVLEMADRALGAVKKGQKGSCAAWEPGKI